MLSPQWSCCSTIGLRVRRPAGCNRGGARSIRGSREPRWPAPGPTAGSGTGENVIARNHRGLPALAGILALIPLAAACSGGEPFAVDPSDSDETASPYVGRGACVSCHAHIAESYAGTGMGRSFYPLNPAVVEEDFHRRNRFEAPGEGLAYTMTRRGNSFWMTQEVLDSSGRVLASQEREMRWVVGSGNHSRSYLTSEGGLFYQMPVCWYPGKPGWDYCPGYEEANSYFNRKVEDSCLSCHNARMDQEPEGSGRYVEPIPHGIDCEKCHGPGRAHVRRWKDRKREPSGEDDSIVNPARLDMPLRMHVCAQCHMGGADSTERLLRHGRESLDYRPGEDLARHMELVALEPAPRLGFGLSSQVERLSRSRCFTVSGGALDCLTCHDPHASVYAEEPPAERFRAACLQCHTESGCALEEGERIARAGADDCVACHMRKAEPADQRFTRLTDHWIRRDPAAPGPGDEGEEVPGLRALMETGASSSEQSLHMGTAWFLFKLKSPHLAGRIPWSLAEGHLQRAVKEDPSLAQAWNLLGRIAQMQGLASQALGCFREAVERDPDHFLARRNLGTALLEVGRAREALQALEAARDLEPLDMETRVQIGRARVLAGEDAEAGRIFDELLEEQPHHAGALANAGLLAARQGRHGEAVDLLRRAAAADPGEVAIWSALASSLVADGRPGEAVGPARRAVDLAPQAAGAHAALGRILAGAGRLDEAVAAIRESLRLQPGGPAAREMLRSLEAQLLEAGSPSPKATTAPSTSSR